MSVGRNEKVVCNTEVDLAVLYMQNRHSHCASHTLGSTLRSPHPQVTSRVSAQWSGGRKNVFTSKELEVYCADPEKGREVIKMT